jgi:hypothetical protein
MVTLIAALALARCASVAVVARHLGASANNGVTLRIGCEGA